MGQHSITHADTRLAELVELARKGEPVVLTIRGEKVAEIRPWRAIPGPLSDEKLAWLEGAIIEPAKANSAAIDTVSTLRDEWDR